MAGLLSPDGQAAPAPDSGAVMAEQGQGQNATPEEQAQYDEFVTNGIRLMMQGEGEQASINPGIMQALQSGDEPQEGLARATATIVLQLMQSAKQAGTELSGDVVLHGGVEILEHLVEIAEQAGIHEYSEEEMEGALYRALDIVREEGTAAGLIDAEALQQEFGQLAQAEAQGRADDVLPGITAAAQRYGGNSGGAGTPGNTAEMQEGVR